METIYNFCGDCNNTMYIYLEKETSELYLYCKTCQNKIKYEGKLIYNNDHTIDISESINNNKYINYDITLPHIKSDNIKCTNEDCKSIVDKLESDIIFSSEGKMESEY